MNYEPEFVRDSIGDILDRIAHADDNEITMITEAIIRRYENYYPDWEIAFISLHKDPVKRKQDLENIYHFLKEHC